MSRVIIFLTCILAISALSKKRHHHKAKQVKVLPHAPSAGGLANHFGLQPGHGNYGPKTKTDLKRFMLKDRNGRWSVASAAIGGPLKSATPCDISQNSYYNFCVSITDCNNCALSENCGIHFIIQDGATPRASVSQLQLMMMTVVRISVKLTSLLALLNAQSEFCSESLSMLPPTLPN